QEQDDENVRELLQKLAPARHRLFPRELIRAEALQARFGLARAQSRLRVRTEGGEDIGNCHPMRFEVFSGFGDVRRHPGLSLIVTPTAVTARIKAVRL